MDVFHALQQRRSVRAFLPQAPSADTVRALMEGAARAASGGNLQPWRVLALAGEPRRRRLQARCPSPARGVCRTAAYPPICGSLPHAPLLPMANTSTAASASP